MQARKHEAYVYSADRRQRKACQQNEYAHAAADMRLCGRIAVHRCNTFAAMEKLLEAENK